MRRFLLIFLSLVLALIWWNLVCAQGFNAASVQKGNYAPVPKTGQTLNYAAGDDGGLGKGVSWPTPRFTDNGNGTVTDKLTGLLWLKEAKCFNACNWTTALSVAVLVRDPYYGLSDGSQMGDWRLPNFRELQSLVDFGHTGPALPAGHLFDNVQSDYYWSSSTFVSDVNEVWTVSFHNGDLDVAGKTGRCYVWVVRDGP